MGLLDYFFGSKPNSGLLAVPKGSDQQAYKDYAEQQMVAGKQPLTFPDWYKQQQAQQAQQAQKPK